MKSVERLVAEYELIVRGLELLQNATARGKLTTPR
jgi:hypothetical protein